MLYWFPFYSNEGSFTGSSLKGFIVSIQELIESFICIISGGERLIWIQVTEMKYGILASQSTLFEYSLKHEYGSEVIPKESINQFCGFWQEYWPTMKNVGINIIAEASDI